MVSAFFFLKMVVDTKVHGKIIRCMGKDLCIIPMVKKHMKVIGIRTSFIILVTYIMHDLLKLLIHSIIEISTMLLIYGPNIRVIFKLISNRDSGYYIYQMVKNIQGLSKKIVLTDSAHINAKMEH